MSRMDGSTGDALRTPASLAAIDDFVIGTATISPSRRVIAGPAGEADVEPRVMQVLVILAEAGGSVVTRETLFDRCWGGTWVGDDSLNRAIAAIRRLVAETAPGVFEVETIPRTGYRLTIAPRDAPISGGSVDEEAAGGAAVTRRSLVALAAGAAGIAALGVWTVVRPRPDPRFDALIERARAALREEHTPEAAQLLRQAIAIRPESAQAWGLLAYTSASLGQYFSASPAEHAAAVEAADRAARRAFALDPQEPNALLGMVLLQNTMLDWAAMEDRLRHVLRIDSGNTLAMNMLVALLQATGRNRDSWDLNERLIAVEPLSPSNQFRRAFKHWIAGRVASADRVIVGARDLWPNHPGVWFARFIIFAFTDRPRAALEMLEDIDNFAGMTPQAVTVWRKSLAALEHKSPEAIASAREAVLTGARQSPGIAANGVMILGALGEVDAAFDIANGFLMSRGPLVVRQPSARQLQMNNPEWRWTQWLFAPPTATVRADPRFGPLCDGIGLTDYWRKRRIRPDYQLT